MGDSIRMVIKKLAHLASGAQMPFHVHRQQPARCIESLAMTDAGEYIKNFAFIRRRVVHSPCSEQWQIQGTGDADSRTVAMFFFSIECRCSST